jgi:MoaA/NifB/PqqE/SkfB family radical SAM enzyme
MATGVVNGCACRDADATLRLGDVNETPLRDIISSRNPIYMDLIDAQQRGDFPPVCGSCDFYSSIYHCGSGYRKNAVALETLAQFKLKLT